MFAHRDGGQHPGDIQCHPPESTEGVTTDCEAIFETYHARAFFSTQTCTVESRGDARVTLGPIGGSGSFLEKLAPPVAGFRLPPPPPHCNSWNGEIFYFVRTGRAAWGAVPGGLPGEPYREGCPGRRTGRAATEGFLKITLDQSKINEGHLFNLK